MIDIETIKRLGNEVMKELGPYYRETTYEEAFAHELRLCNIPYERQRNIEIIYKGFSVGFRRPDCILYPLWSGSKEEFLVEMKSVSKIEKHHLRQAEIYLASMNIKSGVVLNFNQKLKTAEVEEVQRPDREVKKETSRTETKRDKVSTEELLKYATKEVLDYLGLEFLYSGKDAMDIYINSIGVELRLNGLDFYSVSYPVLYKSQKVADYTYDFVFNTGEVAKIFVYKKQEEINQQLDEFKHYNSLFGIKSAYIVAIPYESNLDIVVKSMEELL
ncbi:MAG: GxxExxY protein [Endomicrobiia bacterium]